MKLAALFSVYNGLELLPKSISNIRPCVDEIIIGYQTVSNTFQTDFNVEKVALETGLPVVKFSPNPSKNTKENEFDKHNLMIEKARSLGVTHFLMMATDHFYFQHEFNEAKKKAIQHDVTFTSMYTYYKYPTWQLTTIENYLMPFICELKPCTKFDRVSNYPFRVDPSLKIASVNPYVFTKDEIMMHHYSMIRTDIKNKFENAAASIRWSTEQKQKFVSEYENYSLENNFGISYFQGAKVKEVENYFGI